MTDVLAKWRTWPLAWSEGLRALVCLIPLLVATALDQTTYLVTLGQGAFFFSTLFLPPRFSGRIVMGSLVVALGLGFYLIGGAVAPTPWIAVVFTFFVCVNLSYLSGWKIGGPLALTLVMIYTAGLNAGSPQKASANFLVFAFVMSWSAVISLLPFWTPLPPPPVNENQATRELSEQGFRMGIGTSLALAISYIAGFAKIGWAPSAVGNVVRYDQTLSRTRLAAVLRHPRRRCHGRDRPGVHHRPADPGAFRRPVRRPQRPVQTHRTRKDAAVLHCDHPAALQRQRPNFRQ